MNWKSEELLDIEEKLTEDDRKGLRGFPEMSLSFPENLSIKILFDLNLGIVESVLIIMRSLPDTHEFAVWGVKVVDGLQLDHPIVVRRISLVDGVIVPNAYPTIHGNRPQFAVFEIELDDRSFVTSLAQFSEDLQFNETRLPY